MTHLAPILYSVIDIIMWLRAGGRIYSIDVPFQILPHAGLFYDMEISGFPWEITRFLQSAYQCLQEYLHAIRYIKYKYMFLNDVVQEINVWMKNSVFPITQNSGLPVCLLLHPIFQIFSKGIFLMITLPSKILKVRGQFWKYLVKWKQHFFYKINCFSFIHFSLFQTVSKTTPKTSFVEFV